MSLVAVDTAFSMFGASNRLDLNKKPPNLAVRDFKSETCFYFRPYYK